MLAPESHGLRKEDVAWKMQLLKHLIHFHLLELQLKLKFPVSFSIDKNKYLPGKWIDLSQHVFKNDKERKI